MAVLLKTICLTIISESIQQFYVFGNTNAFVITTEPLITETAADTGPHGCASDVLGQFLASLSAPITTRNELFILSTIDRFVCCRHQSGGAVLGVDTIAILVFIEALFAEAARAALAFGTFILFDQRFTGLSAPIAALIELLVIVTFERVFWLWSGVGTLALQHTLAFFISKITRFTETATYL